MSSSEQRSNLSPEGFRRTQSKAANVLVVWVRDVVRPFGDPDYLRKFLKKLAYLAVLWGLAFLFYFLGWRSVLVGYLVFGCLLMVCAILLQSGKGGGLAGLGGMGGEQILGTRAATPVAKATMALGVLFVLGSLLLARMPVRTVGSHSVIRPEDEQKEQRMPLPAEKGRVEKGETGKAEAAVPSEPAESAEAPVPSPAPAETGKAGAAPAEKGNAEK